MYAWSMCLNGFCIIGRTWAQWLELLEYLVEFLELEQKRRIIVYVHNLAFDFQFLRKWLTWKKVFCIDDRKIARAETVDGIEFKCSYILSGYSLAKLSDQLTKYKITKAVGDLDYNLIRHSETPLTEKEIGYLARDTLVVCAYIAEQIEIEGGITKIPLTKTSYVRRYCRRECIIGRAKAEKKDTAKYRKLMQALTLTPDDYAELKRAFQGGFTHAGALKAMKTLEYVGSADLTSSYPTVELSERFPMSSFKYVDIYSMKEFEYYRKHNCIIFNVRFTGLDSKTLYESPLAFSKCRNIINARVNNGRIVSADQVETTITEVDFEIFTWFYTWDNIAVGECRIAEKGYLPKRLASSILEFYKDKTTLKGVPGAEVDYMLKKGMLNSNFGMMVTDIVRDEITYESAAHIYGLIPADTEKQIAKYNADKSRFLFYPWGVYITAYARKNLFSAIYEFGGDYVYSDTDSIKGLNFNQHKKYFDNYNNLIVRKLEECMHFHGLDPEQLRPKTIQGKEAQLGIWDYEGEYRYFKTLGAKRYMTYKGDELNITVAGLNKQCAVPYICKLAGIPYTVDENGNTHTATETAFKAFEIFDDDLYIPGEYTGKKTHTYIDMERKGIIVDYTGKPGEYYEKSAIHLEQAEYSLNLSDAYIDYIRGIRDKKI